MSTRLWRGVALAGVAVMTAAGGASAASGSGAGLEPSSAAADDAPSRLLVTGREYGLSLSRTKVDAGEAIIQLYDFGEDPHDLVLQRVGSLGLFTTGEVLPGETGELRMKLRKASRYRLWCSIEGHAELGMYASLRTSRR